MRMGYCNWTPCTCASDKAEVTPDVWLIDLLYLAATGRKFASAEQVDRSA